MGSLCFPFQKQCLQALWTILNAKGIYSKRSVCIRERERERERDRETERERESTLYWMTVVIILCLSKVPVIAEQRSKIKFDGKNL